MPRLPTPLRSLLPLLLAGLASACSGPSDAPSASTAPTGTASPTAATEATAAPVTLSSMIRLEPEDFDDFLATMRANAG